MELDEINLKLDIYFTIKFLIDENLLSLRELEFLDLYFSGYSYREIANIVGADRDTVRISIPNSINLIKERQKYENMLNLL